LRLTGAVVAAAGAGVAADGQAASTRLAITSIADTKNRVLRFMVDSPPREVSYSSKLLPL
jgi:hypothetical protein